MIPPQGVCLAWVHAGTVRAEFMDAILGVLTDLRTRHLPGRYVTFSAGPHIAVARNEVTAGFLAGGREPWLFMADTDLAFGPRLLTRLGATASEQDRPVVSGVYWQPVPGGQPVPALYDRHPDGPGPEFTPLDRVPPGQVIEVGGCGAGLLLIHRAVLEAIGKAGDGRWWDETPARGGGITGEDLAFCRRVTAAGYPLHADTDARAGHMKTTRIEGGR